MKSQSILAITLALAFVSGSRAFAQDTLPPDDADKARTELPKKQVQESQKQAHDEMQRANQELRKANGEMEAAHAQLAKSVADAGSRDRLFQMFSPSQNRSLVILSSEVDPKVQDQIEEDLGIMAHIFDKALEDELGAQGRGRNAMGINLMFGPFAGGRNIYNIYLEGYGAVFMVNVNFPVQPPAKSEPQKQEATSSDWEQAKEELYGQHSNGESSPKAQFSQEKIDRLQEAVLGALKNAANIRDLKSDESITVVVLGSETRAGGRAPKARSMSWSSRGGAGQPGQPRIAWAAGGAGGRSSIMTIRVKKSDAESFAKGKWNLDDFRKKARITAYSGDGANGEGSGFVFGFGGSGDGDSD
jgi:hypothetical protein